MAMLAEPRRKQKIINLRAKNNAWSNDTNKFGQRMLEKMGWSSGKGLGANENGIVEHVVAKYKNDDKGLGFEDRNDQWTKHEDDFNALLANLSNGNEKQPQELSGVSLEVKSKKSKARVHYHKFTRGKDLSRYSKKDLANIFGKKTLEDEEKTEEKPTEDIKLTEQVFTEKGSMADYFKSKLQALGAKNKYTLDNNNHGYDEADCAFRGFSGTTNDEPETENTSSGFGFYSNTENKDTSDKGLDITETVEVVKKNKKKKKSKHNDESDINEIEKSEPKERKLTANSESDICIPFEMLDDLQTPKKKKSKQEKVQKNDNELEISDILDDDVPKKQKKKRKNSFNGIENIEDINQDNQVIKKKKKKKNKTSEN